MNTKQDNIYQPANIHLFKLLYGEHLISLGRHAAIENMFSDINLKQLTALDLGFGLGGVAFYLAKKYQMDVSGIELHPWMVEYATTHAPKELAKHLNFNMYNANGDMPYDKDTFDIVYSKGVLNHVADKEKIFSQVYDVLKPGGMFVIADWIFTKNKLNENDPLAHETQQSYFKVLDKTNFVDITFRNDSNAFMQYIQSLIKHVTQQQKAIETDYGKEIYTEIVKQHRNVIKELENGTRIATRIVAVKE